VGRQLLDRLHSLRRRPCARRSWRWPPEWEPLGAIAIGYPEESSAPALFRCRPTACWCAGEMTRIGRRSADALACARYAQDTMRHASAGFIAGAGPDGLPTRMPVTGHVTGPARLTSQAPRMLNCTRFGRWLQRGGHCEDTDTGNRQPRTARKATEEYWHRRLLRSNPELAALNVHPSRLAGSADASHSKCSFIV